MPLNLSQSSCCRHLCSADWLDFFIPAISSTKAQHRNVQECLVKYIQKCSQFVLFIFSANNRTTIDLDTSATSLVSSSTSVYSSFPVDVVVYIRVQPSLVRFTCLPVSRVECLLRMPSLDVVFSTKKADVESNAISDPLLPSNTKGECYV